MASARAFQLASMMFSWTPTVVQALSLSWNSMKTRTLAAVPASELTDALNILINEVNALLLVVGGGQANYLGTYTVAGLPASPVFGVGAMAFASNGRKVGEGAGSGTGVEVYYSGGGIWRVLSSDAPVTS